MKTRQKVSSLKETLGGEGLGIFTGKAIEVRKQSAHR
jgi:hypothetical protein